MIEGHPADTLTEKIGPGGFRPVQEKPPQSPSGTKPDRVWKPNLADLSIPGVHPYPPNRTARFTESGKNRKKMEGTLRNPAPARLLPRRLGVKENHFKPFPAEQVRSIASGNPGSDDSDSHLILPAAG